MLKAANGKLLKICVLFRPVLAPEGVESLMKRRTIVRAKKRTIGSMPTGTTLQGRTRDGTKIDSLLYAGNNLDKARRIYERAIKHRPSHRRFSSGPGA